MHYINLGIMSQSSPWKPNVLRKVKKIGKGKKPTKEKKKKKKGDRENTQ